LITFETVLEMSVVDSTTGETINLNEIYSFLLELIPKCGQIVRDAFYKEKSITEKQNYADFGKKNIF
jgi:hypothetical protein